MTSQDAKPERVKISQLPIYGTPESRVKYRFEEDVPSGFQQTVSGVRQVLWDYMDSMQGTREKILDKCQVAKAHTKDFITYIQDDPGILPKAGVITVAGLGGIVAGYRGGMLRKLVLSGTAMTAAASLCYPNQAVAISTDAYNQTYSYAKSLWDSTTGAGTGKPQSKQKDSAPPAAKPLEDHGQSKAEDKDMYTTRS